jgi:hypothetical protein
MGVLTFYCFGIHASLRHFQQRPAAASSGIGVFLGKRVMGVLTFFREYILVSSAPTSILATVTDAHMPGDLVQSVVKCCGCSHSFP